MSNYNEYRNPFQETKVNLEVAIGAIEFRDKTIANLRKQISMLRASLLNYEDEEVVNTNQFAHLRKSC